MSSSLNSSSPDRPDIRSSHDQDKPAGTRPPETLGHPGWRGVSDPLSQSVVTDPKVLRWHTVQARTRALLLWADDPRREAQVPGMHIDMTPMFETVSRGPHSFDAGVHTELEADGDTVRVVVHLKPYMLYPDWDVPSYASTWLLELVDGAACGSMQTIQRPSAESLPPESISIYPRGEIQVPDPARGAPLRYFLRTLDPVNGVAQYTSNLAIVCPTCGRASYNPNDIAHRYCGNCHMFYADMPGSSPTLPPDLVKRDDDRFVCVCGIVVGDRGAHWNLRTMLWSCIDLGSRFQPSVR